MHTCPIDKCTVTCDDEKLMCFPHWKHVPKDLANDVWRAYRNRAKDRMALVKAQRAAIGHVNAKLAPAKTRSDADLFTRGNSG